MAICIFLIYVDQNVLSVTSDMIDVTLVSVCHVLAYPMFE